MLPMSVETIEASFSKLKIIELPEKYNAKYNAKHRCDLAMISIEKELANSFNYIISLTYNIKT